MISSLFCFKRHPEICILIHFWGPIIIWLDIPLFSIYKVLISPTFRQAIVPIDNVLTNLYTTPFWIKQIPTIQSCICYHLRRKTDYKCVWISCNASHSNTVVSDQKLSVHLTYVYLFPNSILSHMRPLTNRTRCCNSAVVRILCCKPLGCEFKSHFYLCLWNISLWTGFKLLYYVPGVFIAKADKTTQTPNNKIKSPILEH